MGLNVGFEDTDRDPPGEAILLHPEKLETGGVRDGPLETVPLEEPGFLVANPGNRRPQMERAFCSRVRV